MSKMYTLEGGPDLEQKLAQLVEELTARGESIVSTAPLGETLIVTTDGNSAGQTIEDTTQPPGRILFG